jgi:hypothetical protein
MANVLDRCLEILKEQGKLPAEATRDPEMDLQQFEVLERRLTLKGGLEEEYNR